MKDTCGRQIDYLRISITDLCNLRCRYCIPEAGVSQKRHTDILRFEEIQEIVQAGAELGITKVRITGGEPLVRPGVERLVRMVASVPGIRDVAMTTNGLLLADKAHALKDAGLNRVNVSLDTLNPDRYREITRGGDLNRVLEGIRAARDAGLTPIKINAVLIGGFNDDEIEDFVERTLTDALDVRFIELMPVGEACGWSSEHFISNDTVLRRVPRLRELERQDFSSPARYYRLPGALGKLGLINPVSSHFCEACNRIRLTADGKLKPCLHSNDEVSLRDALDGKESLKVRIREAIAQKPERHAIGDVGFTPVIRNMHQIGG